ncbi:MAG TPA: hypothetical protein VEI74_06515 [Candidatus Methylomirabilis sp.]|nr:hypothetical protein [Candidatus Methylomirabilis sp.]
MARADASSSAKGRPNGDGMAAILAAGVGCAALGLFAFSGDAFESIDRFFNFYNPTGTLSGVTLTAIVVWLAAWRVLANRWGNRDVPVGKISLVAGALLVVGLVLTFPPFIDLLQGK